MGSLSDIIHQHTDTPEDEQQRKEEIPKGNIKIEHIAQQKKCADDRRKTGRRQDGEAFHEIPDDTRAPRPGGMLALIPFISSAFTVDG